MFNNIIQREPPTRLIALTVLSYTYLYMLEIPSEIDGPLMKHILMMLVMFTVGEEEESPFTMLTPVLPFIRRQSIYSGLHIREARLQVGIPFELTTTTMVKSLLV